MPNANEPRFPTHVAIIVDGNRRWAKQRMLPVSVGHKAGFDRLREITRYAVGDRGVFVLSLYVFSTENFSRDAKEVGYLMADPYFCKISKDPSIAERAGIQPFWGFFRLFLRVFYWIGRYSGFFSLNRT